MQDIPPRILDIPIRPMGLFVRIITLGWASAITLRPWGIFMKQEKTLRKDILIDILEHEIGHWFQQTLLGYLFYIFYFFEWLIKIFIYWKGAYKNLSFEREARDKRGDWEYWINRKPFATVKYL